MRAESLGFTKLEKVMKDSVLKKTVSCFKNYETAWNPKSVNMLDWIISGKYKSKVMQIRSIPDKKERDKLKAELPVITPSGTFKYRSGANLVAHSGLIQFDIDLDENNQHITNWGDLKKEICKIRNVAYCGLSVSGNGYWGLIPISSPEHHKEHFNAIEAAFKRFGIKLDGLPKNIASARGYSYDSDAYFNNNAETFTLRIPDKVIVNPIQYQADATIPKLLDWLIKKMRETPQGERHGQRLKLGRALGGYISGGLLSADAEEIFINSYLTDYGSGAQKKEVQAIKDGINEGMKFPIHKLMDNNKAAWGRYAPEPQPAPVKKYQYFQGGTWKVEINKHGYPALWDI